MGAPTPTARQAPSGNPRFKTGFKTLVTFGRNPSIKLWETAVTPANYDGGDPIDTTTMFNDEYMSKAPGDLVDVQGTSFSAAYNEASLTDILEQINVLDEITITHPDGSTEATWGWLRGFERGEQQRGEMPIATVSIEWAMEDTDGAEQGPVVANVTGT